MSGATQTEATQAEPVSKLAFEDALVELESIVSELERGDSNLEQSIERFERGVALARRCEDRLDEADKKLAILLKEGSRVVEVDMATGERISETELEGDEVVPAKKATRTRARATKATATKAAPPRDADDEPTVRGASDPRIADPSKIDDDDIPF